MYHGIQIYISNSTPIERQVLLSAHKFTKGDPKATYARVLETSWKTLLLPPTDTRAVNFSHGFAVSATLIDGVADHQTLVEKTALAESWEYTLNGGVPALTVAGDAPSNNIEIINKQSIGILQVSILNDNSPLLESELAQNLKQVFVVPNILYLYCTDAPGLSGINRVLSAQSLELNVLKIKDAVKIQLNEHAGSVQWAIEQ